MRFVAPAFALLFAAFTSTSAVSSNFFEDAWGVVTDPLGLKKASGDISESLDRTLIQLRDLEGVANNNVKERLEQIRSILKDVINGSQTVVDVALFQMRALEADINMDAISLLYRTQCAALDTADQLRRVAEKTISDVIKADPGVTVLGIKISGTHMDNIEITDPDEAYISAKHAILDKLDKDINDDSQAYLILSAYQNIERMARFTRCYYIGQVYDILWVQEVNELERLSSPWLFIRPTLN